MKKLDVIGLVVILVLVAVLGILAAPKEAPMGIVQSATQQYIDFGNRPETGNLTAMSIGVWINTSTFDSAERDGVAYIISQLSDKTAAYWGYGLGVQDSGAYTNAVYFYAGYTGNPGSWIANNVLTLNAWNYIEFQWDGSSTPRIVVNGVDRTVVQIAVPTGTFRNAGSSYPLRIGTYMWDPTYWMTFQGQIANPIIWNYQRTVAQAQDAYNSRLAFPDDYGVVFHPMLIGASGLSTFDGATLGGTNTIVDMASGAYGTPHGNPVGAGDTILTWR